MCSITALRKLKVTTEPKDPAVLARARGTEDNVAGAGAIGAVFVRVGAAKAENTENLMKGVQTTQTRTIELCKHIAIVYNGL